MTIDDVTRNYALIAKIRIEIKVLMSFANMFMTTLFTIQLVYIFFQQCLKENNKDWKKCRPEIAAFTDCMFDFVKHKVKEGISGTSNESTSAEK